MSAGCNRKDHGEGRVALELTPKRFTVAVFEEQLSVSVSELFSRVGGTCGWWLGVGILGILFFPRFHFFLVQKKKNDGCPRCNYSSKGRIKLQTSEKIEEKKYLRVFNLLPEFPLGEYGERDIQKAVSGIAYYHAEEERQKK